MSALFVNEIDFSKLTYEKKRAAKNGPENCKAKYNGGDLNIQPPRMKAPFGVSDSRTTDWGKGKDAKFTMEVSLDTGNKKVEEFKNFLTKMDNHNLEFLAKNSMDIYGEEFTKEEIRKHKKYTNIIKEKIDDKTKKKNSEYPDRFRATLNVWKGEPKFSVYKEVVVDGKKKSEQVPLVANELNELDWSWSTKGMEVVPIITCKGLWIVNKKDVYCAWEYIRVKVCSGGVADVEFRKDADEDEEVVEEEEEEEVEFVEEEEAT